MTALISYFGCDSRGPSSIYIASDSRLSWRNRKTGEVLEQWDRARKVFASHRYAEAYGYCGDALFPTQLLGQAIDLLDRDLLYLPTDSPSEKIKHLQSFLQGSLESYTDHKNLYFELIYVCRENERMKSQFHAYLLTYTNGSWALTPPEPLPEESGALIIRGTGEKSVVSSMARWSKSDVGNTSRSIYSAFHEAVESNDDPCTGGAPQLVGIYREGPAKVFGIVASGGPYVLGAEPLRAGTDIKWHNSTFERCDPHTYELIEGGKRQPRPKGL